MKQRPAPDTSAARRLLLGLCYGLFALAAAGERASRPASAQSGGAPQAAQKVTFPLTVCVYDDEDGGRLVSVQPTLFNSRSVISQKTSDGCYTNPSVILNQGQVYFVAAVSDGRIAYKEFKAEPNEKNEPVKLRLAKKGGEQVARIEICAKDEGGVALPITEVKPAWEGGVLNPVQAADPNCYRVTSAHSAEYKLSLTAKGAQGAPTFSPTELRIVGSTLVLITLVGLALAAYLLLRLHWLAPLSARRETVEKLDEAVGVLSELTPAIGKKVDDLNALVAALPEKMRPPAEVRPDGTGSADAPAVTPATSPRHRAMHAETTQQQPPAEAPRQGLISEDARRKYKELSSGLTVEHFYLMPSGSSTASGMVEDTKIELVEQGKGSYVGFRSAAKEGEAMVFPMPHVHFTQETFKALFPDLTAQDYVSGNIEPRTAVNTQGKVWKVV